MRAMVNARWIPRRAVTAWLTAAVLGANAPTLHAARPPQLTAEQVVEKNVAARGGLDAWRKIQSVAWQGHMESSDAAVPRLTFLLELKRPNKTRFELNSMAEKTLRLFDGTRGWKIRPRRDGSVDTQPYTPQDLKFAREAQDIDGPLIDYQAKGSAVELSGFDTIEGRNTYRLTVKTSSGDRHVVWIDTKTFLDAKYDRATYGPTGELKTVSVMYRNYQSVEGLKIPGTLEILAGANSSVNRMVIDKIALNPPLDDKVFAKPEDRHRRHMATVDIEGPPTDPRNAFAPMVGRGVSAATPP